MLDIGACADCEVLRLRYSALTTEVPHLLFLATEGSEVTWVNGKILLADTHMKKLFKRAGEEDKGHMFAVRGGEARV